MYLPNREGNSALDFAFLFGKELSLAEGAHGWRVASSKWRRLSLSLIPPALQLKRVGSGKREVLFFKCGFHGA
jgi:hypothetical protein